MGVRTWSSWLILTRMICSPLDTYPWWSSLRRSLTKMGLIVVMQTAARRGKYCRRFLTISSSPGNRFSWQSQVSDAGCHVMITTIRDIIMTSWHSSPHISHLRPLKTRETGSVVRLKKVYFSEICTHLKLSSLPHKTFQNSSVALFIFALHIAGAFSSRAPGSLLSVPAAPESSLWAHKHIIKGARARRSDSVVAGLSQTQSRSWATKMLRVVCIILL